jgi:2-hydroxychromene-2-carboxylate isomerase
MKRLEFWYDLASTYSFLSAMRIEQLAVQAGVEIVWRPFLLGPIFKEQGWDTSPFNIYPVKGRYMVRDLERLCADRGLAFRLPAVFPANSLKGARIALLGATEGWVAPFTHAVFSAQFQEGMDIASDEALATILSGLDLDPAAIRTRVEDPALKQQLKEQTAVAAKHGIFGAPTFRTTDGELFWGDDRLEQAIGWTNRS